MRTRLLAGLPWALTLAALGTLLLIPPGGPLFAAAWAAVVALVRLVALSAGSRPARLGTDAVFAVGCFLAAFEGGWYLLPAALAFAAADVWAADGTPRPPRWGAPALEALAGIAAAVVGWLALALFVWGPLYASRSSSVGPNGAVEGPLASTNLASVGVSARGIAFLAVAGILLGVIALGAVVHVRFRKSWARWALAGATIALGIIAAAGVMTVGLWLVPGLAFAVIAWVLGRTQTERPAY